MNSAKEKILDMICDYIEKNPEGNIEDIINVAKKFVKSDYDRKGIERVERFYREIPSVKGLLHRIATEVDPGILRTFFRNFVAKGMWEGAEIRDEFYMKTGGRVPFALLISPSMKCNLRCTGCYANDWDKAKELSFEDVDRIVGEARDLGIHWMFILGGEPYFVDYMWDIYAKYPDVEFFTFSNGTLFSDEYADRILKLKNVIPTFSLEGFEEDTDARRGKGVFAKVMDGMDKLKARKIPFGVSSATGSPNVDTVISEEYIDMCMNKGSFISWYFMFMPIGKPDTSLMLNPEQRIRLGKRSDEIRHTKPYMTIDFFNDSPHVGGCIAGSFYASVTSSGDVEPCIFAHFTVDNVHEKSLSEIFASDFFKELLHRQPYNKNLLKPCMMIDNPNVIREVAAKVGARPTDESAHAMLNDPKFMKELEDLSANFTPLADQTWEELYGDVKDKFVTRNEFMEANIAKRLAKREEEAARKAARANKNK
ncbi:radical SAM protein [Clostridium massiliamazoniense]|uniref:radical SAM protein n=1 Tax=Clostridium massiliamazoniense TaxID=1347366 RepID=UPI0006D76DF4|nr:radical SAM protein [Clostridium massiliamazoniense]